MNKNFPKIQMPGGLPGGGMLKLRFDWYINVAICTVKKVLLMLASDSSNAFPGKCFVQCKLILNFTCRSLSDIRSALVDQISK